MTIKILNLYAGIGGNRKLWDTLGLDIQVTAIENNKKIASIYKDFFPKDNVIVTDAHQFLLENFDKFDFIWSSPPCQSHSKLRKIGVSVGRTKPVFPDLKLYEEIIFLKHHFKGKWVIENVNGYYEPLIKPKKLNRHYFWMNFDVEEIKIETTGIHARTTKSVKIEKEKLQRITGFDIEDLTLLRNCVNPKLALHIFKMAFKEPQMTLELKQTPSKKEIGGKE
jgi:DNA (cytosine-5)-methyltransferase 1